MPMKADIDYFLSKASHRPELLFDLSECRRSRFKLNGTCFAILALYLHEDPSSNFRISH